MTVDVSVKLRECGVVWTVSRSVAMVWVTVLTTVEWFGAGRYQTVMGKL
jgi:hypothetical protein